MLRPIFQMRPSRSRHSLLAAATSLACFGAMSIACIETAIAADVLDLSTATHKATLSIRPVADGTTYPLRTYALSPEHQLWLCCSSTDKPTEGKLLITDIGGKTLKTIDTPFIPTAIGFATKSDKVTSVFIAGSGKVAKLSPDGKIVATIDAPNIGNREEVLEKLRETARKEADELLVNVHKQQERVKKQVAALESAPADETEDAKAKRLRRLKLLTQQVKQIQIAIDSVMSGDAGINANSLASLERATALAVTNDYLFVSLPTVGTYGYDVWRLNHELADAKKVRSAGAGCCGQYDIQTDGKHLVIAENCSFEVAFYDTDGNPVTKFGKRSAKEADGFGSCCNPMNVCCEGDEVLTAESSIGHIKRFDKSGKLLAYIGTAPIGGGCKHVALAHDRQSDRYFMFNEDRKCVSVLIPKSEASEESDEDKASRVAMAGLGQKLVGTWKVKAVDGSDRPLDQFLAKKYGQLSFGAKGELSSDAKSGSASADANVLPILAKLSGSEEAAALLTANSTQMRWRAVEQKDDVLRITLVEDNVASFDAHITFTETNSIRVKYSYGNSEPIAELTYNRAP